MKKITFLTLILLVFQYACITDQNKYKETDIFEEYETEKGFAIMHLPPVLFKLVFSLSDDSEVNSKELLDKIDVIKLMFFEENEKSLKIDDIKGSMNKKMTEFNYNLLTRIAEENNDISIYIIEHDKTIHEVLITIVSEKEYIGFNLVGHLTKEDVMNVYQSMNKQTIQDFVN